MKTIWKFRLCMASYPYVPDRRLTLNRSQQENQDKQDAILNLKKELGEKLSKEEVDQKYVSKNSSDLQTRIGFLVNLLELLEINLDNSFFLLQGHFRIFF